MSHREIILDFIENYAWKSNLIKSDRNDLQIKITAMYGIEATLPKAQGVTGDKTGSEVIRRIAREERYQTYANEIMFMNYCLEHLTGLEHEILNLMLHGRSLNNCGAKLGVKRRKLENSYNSMLDKCIDMYVREYQV
ncbi:hypothetical protein [Macrococcus sp. DPC7161]|uniref:hypothetical protein n=1 Tax=Macrococcus sp. DPC7161 TaxID=2507060 RepID=UPI00100C18E4|nr:hypothetical protein [Macrococcus sp. DPC7161]RXK19082.1 hypothetical protein ER639_01850 [Macrococcus sp. DPC7161]